MIWDGSTTPLAIFFAGIAAVSIMSSVHFAQKQAATGKVL